MKAPSKIYVTPVGTWDTKHIPDLSDNIYISKDVLMEWIQEVRAIPHENAITRDLAFQEVVNKLNSM